MLRRVHIYLIAHVIWYRLIVTLLSVPVIRIIFRAVFLAVNDRELHTAFIGFEIYWLHLLHSLFLRFKCVSRPLLAHTRESLGAPQRGKLVEWLVMAMNGAWQLRDSYLLLACDHLEIIPLKRTALGIPHRVNLIYWALMSIAAIHPTIHGPLAVGLAGVGCHGHERLHDDLIRLIVRRFGMSWTLVLVTLETLCSSLILIQIFRSTLEISLIPLLMHSVICSQSLKVLLAIFSGSFRFCLQCNVSLRRSFVLNLVDSSQRAQVARDNLWVI